MAKVFDNKIFNGEVFLRYTETIKDPVKENLLESGILFADEELVSALDAQTGGNFITKPIKGLLGGTPDNYDGQTDISTDSMPTYKQGIVAIGRAKGFTEKDFTRSITGKDFIYDVADQVASYWSKVKQNILLSVLKGVFAGPLANKVVKKDAVAITDILDAVFDLGGDMEEMFRAIIMHSKIVKELAKIRVIDYLKYTDKEGAIKKTNVYTWEGRLVIANDLAPRVQNAEDPKKFDYTCYVLGRNSICHQPLPVKVPVELARDPLSKGGLESLVSRQRFTMQPNGISFVIDNIKTDSPTDAELEDAKSWVKVSDHAGNPIVDKIIPLAAITYTL